LAPRLENDLTVRAGLPDALHVLLADYPRAAWASDPNFHGLVSFWLDRHMMFRDLMARMTRESEAMLNGDRDAAGFAQGVARYGGAFVNNLHGHHQIEDQHYFPLLRQRDPRIAHGFDLLDADHHALDGILHRFVDRANAAITAVNGPDMGRETAAFLDELTGLERLINRHLLDEEDLIVPVILKHGTDGLPG
jgi:hemerythrin-like domain-containing protein